MEIAKVISDWCLKNSIYHNFVESTESTNDLAKKNLTELKQTSGVYFTEFQTHGRGRGQNKWQTPGRNNAFLTSWVFKVSETPQPITSPVMGLALYKAVNEIWPKLNWSLKPPNDLLLNKNKVAGLLIEVVQKEREHFLIVGLGFNLLEHPHSLPDATHLNSRDGLNGTLTEIQLLNYLDIFFKELQKSLAIIVQPQMNEMICRELSIACGAQKISPMGDIYYKDRMLSWKEL
ncbi:MAG: hypothetical protein H6625_04235 [Bdellovibrionaceae bacterium]|nr:hypothetical protein [Pseudobdellovibrionaceae bacterium]